MSFLPLQSQNFFLAGAGVSIGDTVLNLKSFKDINGATIAMADIGSKGYMTIEPGNGSQEEQISFTGVTQNADGSAQLTGISTVLFKSPYSETSGFAKTHAGSVTAVLSNTSGFYNHFAITDNNETVSGIWGFSAVPNASADPVSPNDLARRSWVLSVVNGGAVSQNSLIVAGTAGETVTTGQVVYLNAATGRWNLANASTSTKVYGVQLGIAQSSATVGNSITSGILIEGYDATQSGLTPGVVYYVNDSANVSATAGTNSKIIGQGGLLATTLYFNPNYAYIPNSASAFTPTGLVSPFAGSSAPSGWLLCDGSAVSRTGANTALFALIGTTYGAGNNSTTFNVPDLRSRTVFGVGTGTKVATVSSLSGNVVTVTGLTNANNNEFQTGEAVVYASTGGTIGNLPSGTYYVVRVTNTSFSLSLTLADAQNGNVITLGANGSGVQTFTKTLTARTLADTGGEESHAMSLTDLLAHYHNAISGGGSGGGGWNAGGANSSVPLATSATGGNVAMNVMNPFLALNYIIKL